MPPCPLRPEKHNTEITETLRALCVEAFGNTENLIFQPPTDHTYADLLTSAIGRATILPSLSINRTQGTFGS